MAQARTLHVRCTTWEQVDVFTTRKLRKGKLLSMKVPFETKTGAPVTLGLELPNQLVVAIDGVVQRASPVDGRASRPAHVDRDRADRADRRGDGADPRDGDARRERSKHRRRRERRRQDAGAAAQRAPTPVPTADDLPADERALFQHLSGELRRLRAAAVHDVLGVASDAEPEQIRASWKNLIRRHHPDLVARRNAPAISHLAEELTILSNRAYDRLRAALVAEGRGTIVGPTLSTPPGWLVGFDDIASGDGSVGPRASQPRLAHVPDATPKPRTSPTIPPAKIQGGEAFEQRARVMLGQGDAEQRARGARGRARRVSEIEVAALAVLRRDRARRAARRRGHARDLAARDRARASRAVHRGRAAARARQEVRRRSQR